MARARAFALVATLTWLACKPQATTTSTDAAPLRDAKGDDRDASLAQISDGGVLNATPVPIAAVEAMVNPDKLPPYAGPTGSVEGHVRVVGDHALPTPNMDFARCPGAAKLWGKDFREADSTGTGPRALADAVVAVTGYKGFLAEKGESKTVTIEGCGFKTLTVTLTFGQRLEVKNATDDFWTPVLEPSPRLVMMMAAPHGDPVRIYPKKPGHYLLVDRDRKYAYADVYAFLHPLHTSSDLEGKYRIDGIPVGKVKVNARHPRLDAETTMDLDVRPGVVHPIDLTIKFERGDAGAKELPDAGVYHPPLH